MKMRKKYVALFMAVTLVISGCNGKSTENNDKSDEKDVILVDDKNDNKEITLAEGEEGLYYYYDIEDIPYDYLNINEVQCVDNNIYIAGKKNQTSENKISTEVLSTNIKTGESRVISTYNETSLSYLMESVYNDSLYEIDIDAESNCDIYKTDIDAGNKELLVEDLHIEGIEGFYVDSNENFYVVVNDIINETRKIHVYTDKFKNEKVLDIIEYTAFNSRVDVYIRDGYIYVLSNEPDEKKVCLTKFDAQLNKVYSNVYMDMSGEVFRIFEENEEESVLISSFSENDGMIFINIISKEDGSVLHRYETDEFLYKGNGEWESLVIDHTADGEESVYGYNYTNNEKSLVASEIGSFIGITDKGDIISKKFKTGDNNNYPDDNICIYDRNMNEIDNIEYILDSEGSVSRTHITPDGCIYYIEETYNPMIIEYDATEEGKHIVHCINKNREHFSFDASLYNSELYPLFISADEDGNIYIGEETDKGLFISVYNKSGDFLFDVAKQDFYSLHGFSIKDNKLYISCVEEGEVADIYYLDIAQKKLAKSDMTDDYMRSILRSNDEKYDMFLSDEQNLYGYIFETSEYEKVFGLAELSVSDHVMYNAYSIGKGEFIISLMSGRDITYNIVKKCRSESPIQNITVGGVCVSLALKEEISDFNKNNKEYKISCIDYGADKESLNQFNLDLIENKLDVIVSDISFSVDDYSGGLFVDLSEYIEKDEDINVSGFHENIFNLFSEEGKIKKIAPMFDIQTLLVYASDMKGNKETSWQADEFSEFMYKYGGFADSEYIYLLEYFIPSFVNNYVDKKSFSCNFDNNDFKNTIRSIIENMEYEEYTQTDLYDLYNDVSRIIPANIDGDAGSYDIYNQSDVLFKGYPSDKNSGFIANFPLSFSISANCKNKDAAWQFVRYFFTDEYQNSISESIPLSKKYQDNIFIPVYYGMENYEETVSMLSEEIKEQICDAISKVDSANYTIKGSRIYNILEEEILLYFSGENDIDTMAKSIQSRVSLYLNEIR
ncbi:MAG: extracellular solute-binding protein [Oscillospiraceae bacterium]|nr:extracellular solute-binding protein [Oscillospiraceae bacterium]